VELSITDLVVAGFQFGLYVWFVCMAGTYLLRVLFRWTIG
jgi:hypothetical protein